MRKPSAAELAELQKLATLNADIARANIAAAQASIERITREIAALATYPLSFDPSAAAAQDRWHRWCNAKRKSLIEELSLARASFENVVKRNGRAIAREEAVAILVRSARQDEKQSAAAEAIEAHSLTSPAERYR